MTVPDELAALLEGAPGVDADEQAFPFLTVDEGGFPHVALLSRSELDVTPGRTEVLVAVGSPRTGANLRRDGRAGLIAVGGTVAHYAKLRVVRSIESQGLLGCALAMVEYKADSLGIPLRPIGFRTSAEIARLEALGGERPGPARARGPGGPPINQPPRRFHIPKTYFAT